MFDYIERTPQIRDVLLSGGDPLTLAPAMLEELIARLRAIEHVEIIRIGSRVPVFLPMRVDDALCAMLAKYHPLWLNIHVNHPNEITSELAAAADRLSRAGIPLGNQSVLLAGVNDCVHIQRRLVQDLLRIRVRPYYLYQCDLVEGAGHFRTPVAKGIEIIEGLRGHTSGFAVPQYVIDAPGGGGKIPLGPNYLLSMSDHRAALRNYEGYISIYEEPMDYAAHDPATCPYCRDKRHGAGPGRDQRIARGGTAGDRAGRLGSDPRARRIQAPPQPRRRKVAAARNRRRKTSRRKTRSPSHPPRKKTGPANPRPAAAFRTGLRESSCPPREKKNLRKTISANRRCRWNFLPAAAEPPPKKNPRDPARIARGRPS